MIKYNKILILLISLLIISTVSSAIIKPTAYYKVNWENIQCFVPPCPQYTIQKVNTNEKPEKILDFIFPNGLNKTFLLRDESKTLIVLGSTQPSEKFPKNATDFLVSKVYKSLPLGNKETPSDKYYIFGDNGIRCKKSPCPNIIASLLNVHTQVKDLNTIVQPYGSNVGFFDSVWLSSKNIRSDDFGLIGQATIKNGIITISNSFIYLPDPPTKCPELPLMKCVEGTSMTYSRDENRCLTTPKCTKLGVCTLSIPLCNKGYRLDSFPSTELNGCPKFFCDPEFVDKTHK
ncbi:hypothetical protein ACTA71_006139 [Dictyostelium dimigraforme]